jgi:hypothetical protein
MAIFQAQNLLIWNTKTTITNELEIMQRIQKGNPRVVIHA